MQLLYFIFITLASSPLCAQSTIQSHQSSAWHSIHLDNLPLYQPLPADAPQPIPPQSHLSREHFAANSVTAAPPPSATRLPLQNFGYQGFVALPDDNTVYPPDPSGAVSPEHVLSGAASELRIQDRTGRILRTVPMEQFWAPLGPFTSKFAYFRAVWDAQTSRFLLLILANGVGTNPSLLLARSTTANPLGEWRISRISPSALGRRFTDPKMALAGSSLAISVNLVTNSFQYDRTVNYLMPLSDVFAAAGALNISTFEDNFFASTPASDPDRSRNRVLFVNSAFFAATGNYAIIFKTVIVSSGGINVGNWVPLPADVIAATGGVDIFPQAGTNVRINHADSSMENCTVRGDNVWCVNSVIVRFNQEFRSVIQYYRVTWPASGAITLTERVRIDDSTGKYYYGYPSIAVNRNLDIFIGYNRFSSTDFAGAFFAFRRSTDPAGGLVQDVPVKAGEDVYNKGLLANFWGSYSATMVDPADDTSFWTLLPYAASRTASGTSLWSTYWARITPGGPTCSLTLDRSSFDAPLAGGSFNVNVTANLPVCTFLSEPNASWIQTRTSTRNGAVTTFEYTVAPNRTTAPRTATISFGGETFTVRQPAAVSAPPPTPLLTVSQFDSPSTARAGEAINLAATIRNNGTVGVGSFRVGFYYSDKLPVTTADTFTGVGCVQNLGLVPDELTRCTGQFTLGANFTPGTYYLAAIADDRQELQLPDRSPAIRQANFPLLITPQANAPALTGAGIVHGATAQSGPISPGQILVLYGERLGPTALTTLALDAQGRVATSLAGSRLLIDGTPAPLIYTSASQLSVIVPFAVAGKTSARIVPEFNGVPGATLMIPVQPAAPGLFSVDFSGRNQVAALNQDASVNTAANPAARGDLLVLYGTGAGAFRTPGVDGAVIGLPLPELQVPLTVQIGGVNAEVLYAGPAPGLVSGVFQVNVRIPASVDPGPAVPVRVASGTVLSPAGTTIAVK